MISNKFKQKINKIENEYKKKINPLQEQCKQFENLIVKIPCGEYKGRWGKIMHPYINYDGKIIAQIRPLRLRGNKIDLGDTLWNRSDARTYWNLNKVKKIRNI